MAIDDNTYGFSKEDAGELLNSIGSSDAESGPSRGRVSPQIQIFLTPTGGIPARSGSTLGQANCTKVRIDAFVLTTLTGQTNAVGNMATEDVGEDVYIQAVKINGQWVANWEECPPEGSSGV